MSQSPWMVVIFPSRFLWSYPSLGHCLRPPLPYPECGRFWWRPSLFPLTITLCYIYQISFLPFLLPCRCFHVASFPGPRLPQGSSERAVKQSWSLLVGTLPVCEWVSGLPGPVITSAAHLSGPAPSATSVYKVISGLKQRNSCIEFFILYRSSDQTYLFLLGLRMRYHLKKVYVVREPYFIHPVKK